MNITPIVICFIHFHTYLTYTRLNQTDNSQSPLALVHISLDSYFYFM